MPLKPRSPCAVQTCPHLRPCPVHGAVYDRSRPGARQRGYGRAHEAWRRAVLEREPACRDPKRRHPGELRPATVADHIVPLRAGGTWDLSNGQGLCANCHAAKTAIEDGGFGVQTRGGGG